MTLQTRRALGVLCLDRGLPPGETPPPIPGSIRNPATFDFPVITETASGASVANVVQGDPTLEPAYVAAAQRLVERGAVAISSTCGFSVRYQSAVAKSVNVPVAMSSLLLLPTLLRQVPSQFKIAVLTYDSSCLSDDLLGINDPVERERIVVGGIEGGKFWHDERKRPPAPFDVAAIEADLTACAVRLRAAHQEIGAILLECGAFPFVAPAVRRVTGLPIYDITTICRLLLASVG
ncbi:hypothetical protein IVB11_38450 [Bradyrhizobium sp. 177]|uniref:hypothetical protein n=1 Tax=Bradyrhizobium sp. 177 TaxID=2782647 RepID=UPI001FFBD086|nr:hypothetical protein [Bradyrhizobium sp. 177]MCK1554763.1 hypothetical protein [Bradyrhizobium sp. 177]